MKNKIHKILGLGLTLVLALALVAGFALPVAAAETINEWYEFDYPAAGEVGDWFRDADIDAVGPMAKAINGDLYAYVELGGNHTDHLFKSEDGGRTWADTGYLDDTAGDPVVDMVCSGIDEDIVYVTDGNYVYKSTDAGDEFAEVAPESLEELLKGTCGVTIDGTPITCLDVTYDDDDDPFVFIGVTYTDATSPSDGEPSVLYINEGGYPSTWTDLELHCFHATATEDGNYTPYSIGCAPNWADTRETYVVVSTADEAVSGTPDPHTWVVYTIGTPCAWPEFAELLWDCATGNDFEIQAASRIAFPDDWEDSETLFVGVVDAVDACSTVVTARGGDVYMAMDGSAYDMNVAGIGTAGGCVGVGAVDIISLDIYGDADEAALIAGAYCDTNVYCSEDGGWSWDASEKDPTGESDTYVLWYEDSALAATSGYECAVSLCCGEDYPCEFWNQISLIATDIDAVLGLDHSPGYLSADSKTMFMLTISSSVPCPSLFRYDGTYWERVYCGTIAGSVGIPVFEMLLVSPDFNETNAVFVGNSGFEVWRSLDAGCSWKKMTFPCSPRPYISAGVVIDEDTVIAGGAYTAAGYVYKTTRHGARPWKEYEVATTGDIVSFDLEPGYEDPGTILLGDMLSQVFISEDGGEEWDLVGEAVTDTAVGRTSVAFDPDYATNNTIYAATGELAGLSHPGVTNVIARCVIDPDEDWADQEWDVIYSDELDDEYWGIAVAGDTALYVGDKSGVDTDNGDFVDGGVLRSLNPLEEDPDDIVFERIAEGLDVYVYVGGEPVPDTATKLDGLWLTTDVSDDGCAENVLWGHNLVHGWPGGPEVWVYEDTLAAPVVLDTPVEGQKLSTTHSATLSWNELCGADCYEVSLFRYCPECPDEKVEVDISDLMDCHCSTNNIKVCECVEDDCIVVDGLDSGSTYYWKVRVCIGEPTLSKWSEERTFTTALLDVATLCSPPCGGQDIILTPNFSWDKVSGATGYNIELATTETFTAGVVRGKSTVNAWVTEPLEYATTYYWRVRAEKDGVYSDWSVCIFTTLEEPVVPPPPVVVEPTPPAPVVPAPIIEFPPTPNWVWAIIGIGTALVVVVIVLTVRTRRPPA